MKAWKQAVENDDTSSIVDTPVATGSKRKAVSVILVLSDPQSSLYTPLFCQDVSVNEAEIRSHWESGTLAKVSIHLWQLDVSSLMLIVLSHI